ncbi:MAG: IS66 family transposase [Saprospiraceae bacterium]|nr:IS66 family transposase [Saprospiraceae bacterium]MCW5922626.1 IS66 family transposase [Saprospiraceae bacterium]MCW5922854.1 IS66 family transposase [Saprospiraceae bacterium]MCW5923172.1 IS66 family transposase [Saprospiraceae bacterium]MCW5924365.1 IS66 family transposase [Saprospiraceae bacterium]
MELSNDISVLKDLVMVLLAKVEALESENAALRAEVAELRSRLKMNSKNSHKPPSSDGLSKKPGLPKEPPKKSGGQLGHKGKTLKMVDTVDHVVVHHATSCSCCSKDFSTADVVEVAQKRQVFDIPAPRMEVTEHQLGVAVCCGRQHWGCFPPEVGQPVQYGSRIKALSVLLNNDYKLPLEKIEQLMGDLWGCSFNESTALTANAGMYQALEPIEEQIKTAVLASDVVHFDETGMRVEKKLHWFHVASTALFTHLFVHKKRGKEALESEASLLKDFTKRAVHDCWASYFDFQQCKHALCGAHLLRELTNLAENGSKWASQMHQFVLQLYQASQKGTGSVADPQTWRHHFEQICQSADREEPPPKQGKRGKPKNSKGRNLLNRLVKHRDEWLAFAFEQNVPFTNNQAERDIRCLKTKQKVATNFQTFKGAQHYARIQSFTSTLRKHSMNVFQNLTNAFDRKTIVFKAG